MGRGLALFAPWMVLGLAQDFWRALLFRNGRGAAAALNDGIWVAAMVLAVPIAWWTRSEWAIVGTWGAGASLGGLFGFAQTRMRPVRFAIAWRWWRKEASVLGRWLGVENVLLAAQGQVLIIVLATVLGRARARRSARGRGGVRPDDARRRGHGSAGAAARCRSRWPRRIAAARRWALRLSLVTFSLVLTYLLVAGSVRTQLLSLRVR